MKRTPINPVNHKNRAKAREIGFGERDGPVRARGCEVHTRHWEDQAGWSPTMIAAIESIGAKAVCSGDPEATHVTARGRRSWKGKRTHLVCLCHHHAEMASEHGTGKRLAFETMFELDLDSLAADIAAELTERGIP